MYPVQPLQGQQHNQPIVAVLGISPDPANTYLVRPSWHRLPGLFVLCTEEASGFVASKVMVIPLKIWVIPLDTPVQGIKNTFLGLSKSKGRQLFNKSPSSLAQPVNTVTSILFS